MPSPPGPSVASATSPGSSEDSFGNASAKQMDLQRKRARDRKSQQAMRERTKWTIANLTEQVAFLSRALEERSQEAAITDSRICVLEAENSHLRTQNAALQLSLIGFTGAQDQMVDGSDVAPEPNPWEMLPNTAPPTCLADQILQGFLSSKREERLSASETASDKVAAYAAQPNLVSLLDKDRRSDDDISNVVGDIIRSYLEINTLPKQVAVFYIMSTLLKWMVLQDQQSWDLMPVWLRPTPSQIVTPHAAWIDRIPWPRVREYLVAHPGITLDDFAATYSSSFCVSWPYDPSHILIRTPTAADTEDITINPVYEEHIRQLKYWTVAKTFRARFPEISELMDQDALGD
ncbi:hypothetical protein CONLIGDRAFT_654811 [Coniochaeta ligniaria NRRL 30616]|uniref:BZIP domain-containing protein n=1 Tax=Coniochaeta ligniaria NRRL 30616 TaxID=1408157 RepID=A0A1J7JLN7_9PEZI|nr:hypothetical protein CONLIGDRAFT_654811 [Coniochaeta ligniaria NRRL 30616]